ncbi:MAG TPA: site-2 protease family protein [Solirubrobacteraceae bacterium]|nr:site-2 protease family protein [Solirubrobacteraceae bacterium]
MEYRNPPGRTLPEPAPPAPDGSFERNGLARGAHDRPAAVGPPHQSPGQPHQSPGQPRQSFFKRRIAPLGAAIIAFLAKIKAILLLLPKIKLLVTAASMAVSVAAYASIWGFSFAAGFVILLLVHEMGHVIALRREGIKATAPMFIPFMGAVISARSFGGNALAEARVGLAGPILGSIGSAVCLVIWQVTGHDYWRALAYTGLFLNLFNLLPVVPLDGGRAMAAMTPWMWFAGLGGIIVLAFVFPNPIILIIAVFAAYETYRRWQRRRAGGVEQQSYYRVSPRDRLLVGAVYLALVALLVIGMDATHLPRTLG